MFVANFFISYMFREVLRTHRQNKHWVANGMCITLKVIWWRIKRWHSATMVGHLWMLIISKHLHVAPLDLSRLLISFLSQLPESVKTAPHHPSSSNSLFQDCMCVTFDVNSLLLKEINLYIGNHAGMFQLPRVPSLVRRTYGCTMWKHDPRSTYFHSGTNPLGIWYILVWYQDY